jgi:hypothetical protein
MINLMVHRMFVYAPRVVMLLLATAFSASAQSPGTKPIYPIEFKPGASTAAVKGTVSPPATVGPDMTNEGSEKYSLRVRAGQHLTMSIRSDNDNVLFTLIKPSLGMVKYEIVKKACGIRRWSGTLTASGDYQIVVFTHDPKADSHFKLTVTLR